MTSSIEVAWTEVPCTEKWLALRNGLQRSGKRGIFKRHEKVGFKQVLERSDGVLGFAKTNIHFEEREFDRKLANRHAELVFWKKCRIIQI